MPRPGSTLTRPTCGCPLAGTIDCTSLDSSYRLNCSLESPNLAYVANSTVTRWYKGQRPFHPEQQVESPYGGVEVNPSDGANALAWLRMGTQALGLLSSSLRPARDHIGKRMHSLPRPSVYRAVKRDPAQYVCMFTALTGGPRPVQTAKALRHRVRWNWIHHSKLVWPHPLLKRNVQRRVRRVHLPERRREDQVTVCRVTSS